MNKLVEKEKHEIIKREESLFFDIEKFAHLERVARIFAKSTMVPKQFQENLANCAIAINLAHRLQVDIFMLMQKMYVVHGRPGIEGTLVIALINACKRFTPLKFKFSGKGKTDKGVARPDSCIAYAVEKASQEELSVEITWETVVAEGWNKDKGTGETKQVSKWNTIPEQMFRYRSAAFFGRAFCPEALMGLYEKEELQDIVELEKAENGSYQPKAEKVTLESLAEEEKPAFKDELTQKLSEFFGSNSSERQEFLHSLYKVTEVSELSEDQAQAALKQLGELVKA